MRSTYVNEVDCVRLITPLLPVVVIVRDDTNHGG